MTNTYINSIVEMTTNNVDAFDMAGAYDTLLLGNYGSLIALGSGAVGLYLHAAHETATLDGMVYSANADAVFDPSTAGQETIVVNGEVDSTIGNGISSYAQGDDILVNGTAFGGIAGLFMAGTTSNAVVNGTVSGDIYGIEETGNNEGLHVNGSVAATNADGVGFLMNGSNQDLDIGIAGNIYGAFDGLTVGGSDQLVKNAGHISGGVGVWDSGSTGLELVNDGSIAGISVRNSQGTTIENAGMISMQSQSYALTVVNQSTGTSIENSGIIHGTLYTDATSTVTIENSGNWNGQLDIQSSGNAIDNTGNISKGIVFGSANVATSDNSFINDGTIHGGVSFFAESGTVSSDTVSNTGTITGGISFDTAYGIHSHDSLTNSGKIVGGVSMGIDETLTNAGTIHGNIVFATESSIQSSDVFDNSSGIVIGNINGGSGSDTFIIGLGSNTYNPSGIGDHFDFGAAFGNDVINGFKIGTGHDVIAFSGGDFTSFAELQTHMTQVGANTVITLDPGSTIELTHITMTHLIAADFIFG